MLYEKSACECGAAFTRPAGLVRHKASSCKGSPISDEDTCSAVAEESLLQHTSPRPLRSGAAAAAAVHAAGSIWESGDKRSSASDDEMPIPWWQVYTDRKESNVDAISICSVESLKFVSATAASSVAPPPTTTPQFSPSPPLPRKAKKAAQTTAAAAAADAKGKTYRSFEDILSDFTPATAPTASTPPSPRHPPTHTPASVPLAEAAATVTLAAAAAVLSTNAAGDQMYPADLDDGTRVDLPAPWMIISNDNDSTDAGSDEMFCYFYNPDSKVALWTLQQDPATRSPPLPPSWEIHLDPATRRPFYSNPETGCAYWQAAEIFAEVAAQDKEAFDAALAAIVAARNDAAITAPAAAADADHNDDADDADDADNADDDDYEGGTSGTTNQALVARCVVLHTVQYTEHGVPIKRRRVDNGGVDVACVNIKSVWSPPPQFDHHQRQHLRQQHDTQWQVRPDNGQFSEIQSVDDHHHHDDGGDDDAFIDDQHPHYDISAGWYTDDTARYECTAAATRITTAEADNATADVNDVDNVDDGGNKVSEHGNVGIPYNIASGWLHLESLA